MDALLVVAYDETAASGISRIALVSVDKSVEEDIVAEVMLLGERTQRQAAFTVLPSMLLSKS